MKEKRRLRRINATIPERNGGTERRNGGVGIQLS